MAIEPPIGTSLTRTACRALRQSPTVTDLSHRFATSRPSRLSVPRAFLTAPASGTTAHTRRMDQGAVAGTGPARLPEVMLVFLPSQLAHHNEPKRLSDSSQCRTGGLHGDKGGTPGRLPLSDSQASSAHARLPHLSAASPSTGRGRGGRRGEGRRLEGPVPSVAQSARLGRTPRTCGPRAATAPSTAPRRAPTRAPGSGGWRNRTPSSAVLALLETEAPAATCDPGHGPRPGGRSGHRSHWKKTRLCWKLCEGLADNRDGGSEPSDVAVLEVTGFVHRWLPLCRFLQCILRQKPPAVH